MKASSSAGTRRHAPALSFAATFGASAAAACVAEASTLPLDTAKVRLQLQTLSAGGSSIKYNGPIDVIRRMCAEEGWRSLYNGLTPGLHRQFLFTGIRLGLYDKVSAAVSGGGSGGEATGRTLSYPQKVAIALATSAVGITVANPSDVLKVRAQAHDPKNKVRRSRPRPTLENYVRVTRKEGFVSGLYKGYTANLGMDFGYWHALPQLRRQSPLLLLHVLTRVFLSFPSLLSLPSLYLPGCLAF